MSLLVKPNLVSTIIPVFNRPELIVDAVESVIAQTHRPIEILVVDDGSTDCTPEVLQMLSEKHSELRVFKQANSGPGVARELGRLNARGEFIQYLDSDDLLLPKKFEVQIAALRAQPNIDVAYGKTEVVSMGERPKQIPGRETAKQRLALFPSFLRSRWWFTSTALFRRRVLESIGPWSVLSNEEDWEYECRVAAKGGELVFSDEFVSLIRVHDRHLSSDGSHDKEKLKNRAMARAKIFQHAKQYMELDNRLTDINQSDWQFFSKYVFLLARQCAIAGLKTEARAMLSVSIEANGKKAPQHRVFIKLVKVMGWRRAAKLVEWIKR